MFDIAAGTNTFHLPGTCCRSIPMSGFRIVLLKGTVLRKVCLMITRSVGTKRPDSDGT